MSNSIIVRVELPQDLGSVARLLNQIGQIWPDVPFTAMPKASPGDERFTTIMVSGNTFIDIEAKP